MKKRESNYELMRIIAMLMIVMGHFWGQSGYDEMATGISYIVGQFLGCGSRVAVNLFLFIGIWFMVENQIRAKRLLNLYFNVATITIPISLLVYIWGGQEGVLRGLFPILGNPLWFAVTYLALIAVSPWLNIAINKLSQNSLKKFVIVLFIIICFMSSIHSLKDNWLDTFSWFCFAYLLVGYYKKYVSTQCTINKNYLLLGGLLIYSFLVLLSTIQIPISKVALNYLSDYKSLPNLIISMCVFMFFSRLDIGSKEAINFVSSGAFSVYIFHQTPALINILWFKIFQCEYFFYYMGPIPYMLVVSGMVYCVGLFIDIMRRKYIEPVIIESRFYKFIEKRIDLFYENI